MAEEVRKVLLESSDNEIFEVEMEVAVKSQFIEGMLAEVAMDTPFIKLHEIQGNILDKVIKYCKYHLDCNNYDLDSEVVQRWDTDFVKVDHDTLFDLIMAADYLDIKGLLNLTCQNVANMLKGKSIEDIRKAFNIKRDYTTDEENEVIKVNAWAFE